MSGIQLASTDTGVTQGTKLTALTATAVYTVSGIVEAKGVAMKLANVSGASVNVTIEWHDDSAATQYKLLSTYALAQNTFLDFDLFGMTLDDGDEIRVTASVINALHVVITVTETRR